MPSSQTEKASAVHILATFNHLSLQAYLAETFEALTFQIVNDTQHAIFYNRALLWQWDSANLHLLKISGQTEVNTKSALVETITKITPHLKERDKAQILQEDSFAPQCSSDWRSIIHDTTSPQVCWVPLIHHQKFIGALWLERWHDQEWDLQEMELLGFICAAYSAVWERFKPRSFWKALWRYWSFFVVLSLLLLLLIRVPLRIVAPCEVVAEDPIMVTAPLDGTLSHLAIKPGDIVVKGDKLFEYNKDIPLQHLQASQKQVEICQSELHRAVSLAFNDPRLLSEVEILALKLHKEKIALSIAQSQAQKLEIYAPSAGIVMLDDPERWRGTPINIGEKILQICEPTQTKVRLWIPESDNIILNKEMPMKVFLNVQPESSLSASMRYIASYSHLSDKGVASFLAEGSWLGSHEEIKLGLKGSAILYGEEVSLLYWMIRRPWTATRNFIGL